MPKVMEMTVTIGKTVQEKQYEPLKVEVSAVISTEDLKTPSEIDDAVYTVSEALQDNIDEIINTRINS